MDKLSMVLVSALTASSALAASAARAEDVPAASASAALAISAPTIAAQQGRNDDTDTLAGRGRLIEHHGWFAAPSLGMTLVDGDAAAMMGVRSAWLMNHRFGLGLAANGFFNDFSFDGEERGKVEGGYGGLLLQYVIAHDRRVHAYAETTIGGGAVCSYGPDEDCAEYGFFALEPTANLELNLTRFARASVGVGYRLAIVEDASPLSDRELSGFVARTSVSFGRF